jgi:hypothetical protein
MALVSQDVAYYFKPKVACTVTISLCESSKLASSYDSRLFVLRNVDEGGSLDVMACDDDGCGDSLSQITVGAGTMQSRPLTALCAGWAEQHPPVLVARWSGMDGAGMESLRPRQALGPLSRKSNPSQGAVPAPPGTGQLASLDHAVPNPWASTRGRPVCAWTALEQALNLLWGWLAGQVDCRPGVWVHSGREGWGGWGLPPDRHSGGGGCWWGAPSSNPPDQQDAGRGRLHCK